MAVKEHQLSNGMKVLLLERNDAPSISGGWVARVGSVDERPGITGMAHLFEHMMFKGTKKYPGGIFSQTIAKLGGKENAFTSKDYTAYYQTLPSQYLEHALKFESDRMNNLADDNILDIHASYSPSIDKSALHNGSNVLGLFQAIFLFACRRCIC